MQLLYFNFIENFSLYYSISLNSKTEKLRELQGTETGNTRNCRKMIHISPTAALYHPGQANPKRKSKEDLQALTLIHCLRIQDDIVLFYCTLINILQLLHCFKQIFFFCPWRRQTKKKWMTAEVGGYI